MASKILEQSGMDLSGFRVGKQRLVSKKKRSTALKRVILEERTEQAAAKPVAPGPVQPVQTSNGLCLDAPEFVPLGWCLGPSTPSASSTMPAPGEDQDQPKAREPLKAGLLITGPTPLFVPSWHQAAIDEKKSKVPEPDTTEAEAPQESAGGEGSETESETAELEDELPVAEALERLRAQADQRKAPLSVAKEPGGADLEIRRYVHQVLSDELDEKVKTMLGELVRFQERAKERDPLKYQKLKRFCVGLREASRAISRGKAKCILLAPNIEACSLEGGLDDHVEELVEQARAAEVPVVFALSRNRMGKALGRSIRQCIVALLSAEGVHQLFKDVIKLTDQLRSDWVMRQMRLVGPDDAKEALQRLEDLDEKAAQRRDEKARQQKEQKLREEQQRAEAKEKKAQDKARRAAELEAEQQRRRAEKALREEAKAKDREERDKAKADDIRRAIEQRAEEEKRRKAEEAAARAAEQRRLEAEKKAEEERRKSQPVSQPAAEAAQEEDSDTDSDLPLGFNADLF